MPVYWLDPSTPAFPHPNLADPGGLLAVGGALEPDWLILAYQHGIFPWFEEDGHFFWYSPDPRCVLFPAELKVHKSMRALFNQQRFRYTLDTDFEAVIRACSEIPRPNAGGTWISEDFIQGYTELYRLGIAHSVEVWAPDADVLLGGLYGLSLGRVFYGESMFARARDASKAGFITLVRALEITGFDLIDCQQDTPHLLSLGARNIPRSEFLGILAANAYRHTLAGRWHFDADTGGIRCEKIEPETP